MKNKPLQSQRPVAPASPPPSRSPRTVFTDEFKRDAVAKLRQPGTNATLLALELGIRRNLLYKWAKVLDESAPGVPLREPGRPPTSDESEVVQLRRRLAKAEQELAVLKKCDAYLIRGV